MNCYFGCLTILNFFCLKKANYLHSSSMCQILQCAKSNAIETYLLHIAWILRAFDTEIIVLNIENKVVRKYLQFIIGSARAFA
jgi:hypothetical protein